VSGIEALEALIEEVDGCTSVRAARAALADVKLDRERLDDIRTELGRLLGRWHGDSNYPIENLIHKLRGLHERSLAALNPATAKEQR
jgi:hypothetical protein